MITTDTVSAKKQEEYHNSLRNYCENIFYKKDYPREIAKRDVFSFDELSKEETQLIDCFNKNNFFKTSIFDKKSHHPEFYRLAFEINENCNIQQTRDEDIYWHTYEHKPISFKELKAKIENLIKNQDNPNAVKINERKANKFIESLSKIATNNQVKENQEIGNIKVVKKANKKKTNQKQKQHVRP